MLRRLLREPLLHFLLLGGLIFAIFGRGSSDASAPDRQIVVSGADIGKAGLSRHLGIQSIQHVRCGVGDGRAEGGRGGRQGEQ